MNQFTTKLYTEMERSLQQAAIDHPNPMDRALVSYRLVEKTMEELKQFVQDHSFENEAEEIRFFKFTKPRFQRHLIYFSELIYMEAEKPVADKGSRITFYKREIKRNLCFITRHKALRSYIKLGSENEDKILFLRQHGGQHLYPEYSGDIDTSFCTMSSYNLAKLHAFDMINKHLAREIEQTKGRRLMPKSLTAEKNVHLVWTGTKAELVELAYGLLAKGTINHGRALIKEIIEGLEQTFSIKIGNFYRIYTDLTMRKKSRTPFFDGVKDQLEKRMDSVL